MKLVDVNNRLRDKYRNTVILMKFGNFYRCFYNNAIVVGYIFNYKLQDNKVGFPINNILCVLDKYSIDYLIYNSIKDIRYIYHDINYYNTYLELGNSKYNLDNYVLNINNKVKGILGSDIRKYNDIMRYLDGYIVLLIKMYFILLKILLIGY